MAESAEDAFSLAIPATRSPSAPPKMVPPECAPHALADSNGNTPSHPSAALLKEQPADNRTNHFDGEAPCLSLAGGRPAVENVADAHGAAAGDDAPHAHARSPELRPSGEAVAPMQEPPQVATAAEHVPAAKTAPHDDNAATQRRKRRAAVAPQPTVCLGGRASRSSRRAVASDIPTGSSASPAHASPPRPSSPAMARASTPTHPSRTLRRSGSRSGRQSSPPLPSSRVVRLPSASGRPTATTTTTTLRTCTDVLPPATCTKPKEETRRLAATESPAQFKSIGSRGGPGGGRAAVDIEKRRDEGQPRGQRGVAAKMQRSASAPDRPTPRRACHPSHSSPTARATGGSRTSSVHRRGGGDGGGGVAARNRDKLKPPPVLSGGVPAASFTAAAAATRGGLYRRCRPSAKGDQRNAAPFVAVRRGRPETTPRQTRTESAPADSRRFSLLHSAHSVNAVTPPKPSKPAGGARASSKERRRKKKAPAVSAAPRTRARATSKDSDFSASRKREEERVAEGRRSTSRLEKARTASAAARPQRPPATQLSVPSSAVHKTDGSSGAGGGMGATSTAISSRPAAAVRPKIFLSATATTTAATQTTRRAGELHVSPSPPLQRPLLLLARTSAGDEVVVDGDDDGKPESGANREPHQPTDAVTLLLLDSADSPQQGRSGVENGNAAWSRCRSLTRVIEALSARERAHLQQLLADVVSCAGSPSSSVKAGRTTERMGNGGSADRDDVVHQSRARRVSCGTVDDPLAAAVARESAMKQQKEATRPAVSRNAAAPVPDERRRLSFSESSSSALSDVDEKKEAEEEKIALNSAPCEGLAMKKERQALSNSARCTNQRIVGQLDDEPSLDGCTDRLMREAARRRGHHITSEHCGEGEESDRVDGEGDSRAPAGDERVRGNTKERQPKCARSLDEAPHGSRDDVPDSRVLPLEKTGAGPPEGSPAPAEAHLRGRQPSLHSATGSPTITRDDDKTPGDIDSLLWHRTSSDEDAEKEEEEEEGEKLVKQRLLQQTSALERLRQIREAANAKARAQKEKQMERRRSMEPGAANDANAAGVVACRGDREGERGARHDDIRRGYADPWVSSASRDGADDVQPPWPRDGHCGVETLHREDCPSASPSPRARSVSFANSSPSPSPLPARPSWTEHPPQLLLHQPQQQQLHQPRQGPTSATARQPPATRQTTSSQGGCGSSVGVKEEKPRSAVGVRVAAERHARRPAHSAGKRRKAVPTPTPVAGTPAQATPAVTVHAAVSSKDLQGGMRVAVSAAELERLLAVVRAHN